MAEPEAPQEQLDKPLETLKKDLEKARKKRTTTKDNLRDAKSYLKVARRTLASLRENEIILQTDAQWLQQQQAENTAELESWNSRTQNAQRILALLRVTAARLQDQIRENEAALALLSRRVEDTNQTIEEKEEEVEKCRRRLCRRKCVVIYRASKMIEGAMGQAWKLVPDSLKTLASGGSTGYASVPITSLSYNSVFYYFFGINTFAYSKIQDFVAPDFNLILMANVLVWIGLISLLLKFITLLKIPVIVEWAARLFYPIVKFLKGRSRWVLFLASIAISLLVPGVVAYEKAKSTLSSNKVVHVVTASELKPLDAREPKPINEPVHIGSNSTHAFFYDSNDPENTVALQLPGIICISDENSYCEPADQEKSGPTHQQATIVMVYPSKSSPGPSPPNPDPGPSNPDPGPSPPNPDPGPPPNGKPCDDCFLPALADEMQFYLVHQERGALNDPTRGIKISGMNATWLGAFQSAVESCSQPDKVARLRIDGFASSESPSFPTQQEKDLYNCEVANRRAEETIDFLIGNQQDYGRSSNRCERGKDVYTFGKDHGLNFEIEYRPWQTFKKMEQSRPAIDTFQGTVVPERALLNRSVRIVIEELGDCQPQTSQPEASDATDP